LAQQLPEEKRGTLYNELRAAAESGWDFSYRWYENKNKNLSLVNTSTSQFIPVELNAILQHNANLLAYFYNILGNVPVGSSAPALRLPFIRG